MSAIVPKVSTHRVGETPARPIMRHDLTLGIPPFAG
jgi:hypothetical protein